MDNLINPVFTDALLTVTVVTSILGMSALTLWLLPWTDTDIRSVDKVLNPMDLTEDSLPLRRLAVSRSHLG